MRDSKMLQALDDIAAIASTKLGKEWASVLLPFLLDTQGYKMTRMAKYDGEMIEFTASKIETMVLEAETVEGNNDL